MGGNFTVFQTAVTALGTNTKALSVVGQNIANVNTPGYSRQTAILASANPQNLGGVELGLGVNVSDIKRIYDSFIEKRVKDANSALGRNDVKSEKLKQVENIFNEVNGDGLAKFVNNFFGSWNEVANDPASTSARLNVLSSSQIMTDRFHTLANNLNDSRTLINGDVSNVVTKINSLVTEITSLNEKIQNAGNNSMVYEDQRTQKVKELAQYLDVQTVNTSDGVFQVYAADGIQLVNGNTGATLATRVDTSNDNLYDVTLQYGNGSAVDISDRIVTGRLRGLLDVRDTEIPDYLDTLNQFAYEVATRVNNLHSAGYDLNGTTGVNFFDSLSDNAAGTDLATNIRNSTGQILGISVGDVITISGSVGGTAMAGQTLTVTATTTLADIATALQTGLRTVADGTLTETAAVQADGSILVSADATHSITGLTLSISGKTNFNTAMTFTTPIAGGATGSSGQTRVMNSRSAELIDLNAAVDGNPRALAAASSASELPSGNTKAMSIIGLQTSSFSLSTGTSTFAAFYGDLLAQIGSDSQASANIADFSKAVLNQAEIERETVSGVSLEEEQLDLVKYQAAFQAASRLVKVASDVLDALANLI